MSLSSLERWINSSSQRLVIDREDNGMKLVASLNMLISELHDDIISDRAFRTELARLRGEVRFSITVRIERNRVVQEELPEAFASVSGSYALSF